MFYRIAEGEILETDFETWKCGKDVIAILGTKDWENATTLRTASLFEQKEDHTHFCKLESYADYLFGTFHIPVKEHYEKSYGFVIYVLNEKILFIDDTGLVNQLLKKIQEKHRKENYGLVRFLYDFLISLMQDDLLYLSSIEKRIAKLEEEILESENDSFHYKMLKLKKEISRMHRYYSQMADLGEIFVDNELDFWQEREIKSFRIFTDRVSRLREETQVLREYAMQVQDVYQSEIGIRQNDVMKVLTIVTTIFLPLTLIAGWYGMNFHNMPELSLPYGYPMVFVASIIVVLVSLFIFKKKKYM